MLQTARNAVSWSEKRISGEMRSAKMFLAPNSPDATIRLSRARASASSDAAPSLFPPGTRYQKRSHRRTQSSHFDAASTSSASVGFLPRSQSGKRVQSHTEKPHAMRRSIIGRATVSRCDEPEERKTRKGRCGLGILMVCAIVMRRMMPSYFVPLIRANASAFFQPSADAGKRASGDGACFAFAMLFFGSRKCGSIFFHIATCL